MGILLGCDFCPKLPKIGVKTAPRLIQEHTNITNMLVQCIDHQKSVPENWKRAVVVDYFISDHTPLVYRVFTYNDVHIDYTMIDTNFPTSHYL